MFGFLALIPNWIKFALCGLAGAALVAWGSYIVGKHEGRQQAAVDALQTSVKVLRQRNEIDETISTADAARLCADFGLPDDEAAECVRRLASSDAKP